MIQRLTILGTGLIGGSLGLALKERYPDLHITGHDRPNVLEQAEARGAVDAKAADPATAVQDAEAVVLATPLATTLRLLDAISEHLAEGTIVTDVASVKAPVLAQARDVLPPSTPFIGGHPMAGAEQSGIEHAQPLLFENAVYVLCPPARASEMSTNGEAHLSDTYAPVLDLVEAVGARPLIMDAARHDRIAATISHLPQLVSVALVNAAAEAQDRDEATLQLAAGGFRDMTRIASSPFDMWRDILIGNEGPVLDVLAQFSRMMQRIRNRLIEEDLDGLRDLFESAQAAREGIPRDVKGFLHPLADVYVEAADEPGALHQITAILFEADINIKDVELLKFREGTGGTFRIGFETEADAQRAASTLREADYSARQL